jgi:hypothetical protein
MCKYGKPKESNTEVGEKNHNFFAKCIGHHCQKQHKIFAHQVALHLSDSFEIEKMATAMGLLADEDDMHCHSLPNEYYNEHQEGSTLGAMNCSFQLIRNHVKIIWHLATETHLLNWDAAVATFIQNNYMSSVIINCCTEYKNNQLMMRCHPPYQGEGPWFDWVSLYFLF